METWLIVLIVVIILILIGVGLLCFFKCDSIKRGIKTHGGWSKDEVYYEIKRVLNESCKSRCAVVKVKNDVYKMDFNDYYDILIVTEGKKNCYIEVNHLQDNSDPSYTYYFCTYRHGDWVIERLSF